MGIGLTLDELVQLTGGRLVGEPSAATRTAVLPRVVCSAREVCGGEIAWLAERPGVDIADEVALAFARGASGVVARVIHSAFPADRWALVVRDVLGALERTAHVARARSTAEVIGVAGAVGRCDALSAIAEMLGGEPVEEGSLGFEAWLCAAIEWASAKSRVLVSLGVPGSLEFGRRLALARPHGGVLVDDRQGVSSALAVDWLCSGEPTTRGEASWCGSARRITFGRSPECDVFARSVSASDGALRFEACGRAWSLPGLGRELLAPVLAALAVAQVLELDPTRVEQGLLRFAATRTWCIRALVGGVELVRAAPEGTLAATRSALAAFRDRPATGRRIVVLELVGESRRSAAATILGPEVVSECGADMLLACGELAQELVESAITAGMLRRNAAAFPDFSSAWRALAGQLSVGDAVLLPARRWGEVRRQARGRGALASEVQQASIRRIRVRGSTRAARLDQVGSSIAATGFAGTRVATLPPG